MLKSIGAYMNVELCDYDEDMLQHLVELMKQSLRDQSFDVIILEDSWEVVTYQRTLYKNADGLWESQDVDSSVSKHSQGLDDSEVLEVMTVGLTVKTEDVI